MKTIRDVLDKIDYIVGDREGVSLDLGYLNDADYSLDQAEQAIKDLLLSKLPEKRDWAYETLEVAEEVGYNQAIDEFTKTIEGL